MNIVLLGPPGAGKGTQAIGITERYNVVHISTGDILREQIKAGTKLGLEAKKYMDVGELVPDDVVIGIAVDRMGQPDAKSGCLLDGFPRTLAQAVALDEKVRIDVVIDIQVPDAELVRRLSGRRVCKACGATYHVDTIGDSKVCSECGGELIQRDDDKAETIEKRLKVYYESTKPLVDYYRGKGVLHTVDGTSGIENVFSDIRAILDGIKR